jgi:chromosome segregation ATPase
MRNPFIRQTTEEKAQEDCLKAEANIRRLRAEIAAVHDRNAQKDAEWRALRDARSEAEKRLPALELEVDDLEMDLWELKNTGLA